jgi:hypothetical protein
LEGLEGVEKLVKGFTCLAIIAGEDESIELKNN